MLPASWKLVGTALWNASVNCALVWLGHPRVAQKNELIPIATETRNSPTRNMSV
jgi:hypothetical protein